MATLAAPIATSFISLTMFAWLTTAYLIGQAASQPLSGKLTDIYSRRSGILLSNLLFALGNLLCGVAANEWIMILGRVIAGLGGGGLNTISTLIGNDLVPSRKRGLWQGIGNLFWGVGNGLGGFFGGFVNDTVGWKPAFWLQVPLTIISMMMIWINYDCEDETHVRAVATKGKSAMSRVDYLGSLSLILSLVALLLGLTSGGNIVSWSHPVVLVSLPLAAVFAGIFIIIEDRVAEEPILPLRLLNDRTVLCSCLTCWFFNLTIYTTLFYLPVFYEIRNVSTRVSGAVLVSFSLSFSLGSLGAGAVILRTGRYRLLLQLTLVLLLIGTGLACTNSLTSPLWTPLIALFCVGISFGSMLTVTLIAFTTAVKIEDQAVVTSLSYIFRSTGSVLGLAFSSTIFQNVLVQALRSRLADEHADELARRLRDNIDAMKDLPQREQMLVRMSYIFSLRMVFAATVVFAVLALICGLLVKELPLRTTITKSNFSEIGQNDTIHCNGHEQP